MESTDKFDRQRKRREKVKRRIEKELKLNSDNETKELCIEEIKSIKDEKIKRRNEKNAKNMDEDKLFNTLNDANKDFPKKFIKSIYKLKEIIKKETWEKFVITVNKLSAKEVSFNRFFYIDYDIHPAYKNLDIDKKELTEEDKLHITTIVHKLVTGILNEVRIEETYIKNFKTAKDLEFDMRGVITERWDKKDQSRFSDYVKPYMEYLKDNKKKDDFKGTFSQTSICLTPLAGKKTESKKPVIVQSSSQVKFDKNFEKNETIIKNKSKKMVEWITKILEEKGIMDVMRNRHKNYDFRIRFLNLHKHDGDTNFLDLTNMREDGYIAKSQYFHIDTKSDTPPYKVLIYLNDISEINEGAFRMIPYSHNYYGLLERCIKKRIDDSLAGKGYKENGRKFFMKYPDILRIRGDARSDFGNQRQEKTLLDSEILVGHGSEDNIILFNTNCTHRGCLFDKGSKSHREMLQVWFECIDKSK